MTNQIMWKDIDSEMTLTSRPTNTAHENELSLLFLFALTRLDSVRLHI
jgi:hypothetical protein